MPDGQTSKGETIVSLATTKTAMGDIDTISVGVNGDSEVDLPEGGEEGGVVVTDKVAGREEAEPENPNLSDDVGAGKPGKKPFKKTRDGRIDHFRKLAGDAERTAEDYKRERDELLAKTARLEEEKKQSDYAAVMHYNDALKAKQDKLTRDLRDAKDKADSETEAKLTAEMSRVAADLANVEGWLKTNPKPEIAGAKPATPTEPKPEAKPVAAAAPQELPATVRGWIEENTWFGDKSPDFDPAMTRAAVNYANYLDNELRAQGRGNEINSQEYFEVIDARMRQLFPDRFGDEGDGEGEEEAPPPAPKPRQQGNVMPARGTASTGVQRAQPNPSPNRVVLSQEQREIAHSLILKHPNGQPFSPKEKEVEYAKGLRATQRKG